MRTVSFLSLSLSVLMIACAPPVAQRSTELAAMDDAWEAAFNADDAGALTALYTEDARLLPPNGEMTQGSAAVEVAFGEMIAAGLGVDLEPVETMAVGDLGYSLGTYAVKDADGDVVDRGKYVEIFRNVGGQWKISNDIWNSDLPAEPAGTELIIAHRVKDSTHWLAAFQGETRRADDFAKHGAPSVKLFASPDHPNHHALLIDVTNMAAFQAWADSADAKAARVADGVIDDGFIIFTPVE
ncbi:MAG: DUF4440 domain-containing protein [Acidobacteriota bacterium]|nr:MAG: DUF4440 domain-containing protein [Acidobacteriota bacterium]